MRKVRRAIILKGFLSAALALLPPVRAAAAPESVITLDVEPTRDNPRNSEGSFVALASGEILFCYSQFYGGAADSSPARIVRIQSSDQGRTWSAPVTVVENTGGNNVMSVSLLRLTGGKIAMFYCVKNSWLDCRPHMRISADEGTTWSEPRLVLAAPGYFVLNNDRVIQTKTGRIIMPLAFHRSRGTDPATSKSWDARAITMWNYSDDDGATWQESSSWWAMPVKSGSGLQEPGVVELAEGSLFSWSRTDQGAQYGFTSTDSGKTWSPPVPTEMKSPNDPPASSAFPEAMNFWRSTTIIPAAFRFQKRNGIRWWRPSRAMAEKPGRARKLVENDPDGLYHYTAIHFAGDSILLGYCAGDSKVGALNRLRIRRLNMEWLRQD